MVAASLLLILVAVTLLVLGLASGSSPLLVSSIAASLLAAIALVIGSRQASAVPVDLDDERDADEPEFAWTAARERVAAGAQGSPPRHTHLAETAGERPGGARAASAGVMTEDRPTAPPPAAPPPAAAPPIWRPPAEEAPPIWRPPPEEAPPAAPPSADPSTGQEQAAPPTVPSQQPMGSTAGADQIEDDEDPPDEPAPQVVSPADAARVARMSTQVMVVDGRPRYHLPGCAHLQGKDSEPLPVAEAVELGFTPCSLCEPDTALLA